MEKVLCVCVGNLSRSPMMQAVLQQQLGVAFRVESAGVSEGLAGYRDCLALLDQVMPQVAQHISGTGQAAQSSNFRP